MRKRLESRSFAGERVDRAGMLNKVVAGDELQGRVGLSSYLLLMMAQQGHDRHVRQLNKAHDLVGFDRLHPSSPMRRRVPASPTSDIPANERDDARDDRIGSELRAGRVRDTGGGMDANARTRADYSGQGVRPVEPEWLTVEQMATLAAARALASRYF